MIARKYTSIYMFRKHKQEIKIAIDKRELNWAVFHFN